jgi:hypothetical protein
LQNLVRKGYSEVLISEVFGERTWKFYRSKVLTTDLHRLTLKTIAQEI